MAPIIVCALVRTSSGLLSLVTSALFNVTVLTWDLSLTFYNVLAPLRPANRVVPEGCSGAGGIWPQYIPPTETDSRSSCPALNAMANHGILPRSGKDISFPQMNAAIRATYNFSPTFCLFVPHFIAQQLGRSYWSDACDLSDISVHNGIEHDASLTRQDTFHSTDQSKPDVELVERLLACGTGPGGDLTPADLSRLSGERRAEAQHRNGQFSLSTFHKLFGSSNSSTLLAIFGGKVQDLRPILLEERLPDGWQPSERHRMGLTMTKFQTTVMQVEMGIKEEAASAIDAWRWSGSGASKKTE